MIYTGMSGCPSCERTQAPASRLSPSSHWLHTEFLFWNSFISKHHACAVNSLDFSVSAYVSGRQILSRATDRRVPPLRRWRRRRPGIPPWPLQPPA
jgi:hypothetical protein